MTTYDSHPHGADSHPEGAPVHPDWALRPDLKLVPPLSDDEPTLHRRQFARQSSGGSQTAAA
jgi:hypothetical protein